VPIRLAKEQQLKRIPIIVICEGHHGMIWLSQINTALRRRKRIFRIIREFFSFIFYYFLWELPLFRKYDAIIGVSDAVSYSIHKWHFIKKEKLYVVYNGVDINVNKPNNQKRIKVRKAHSISSDEKILLFLSHLTEQKGVQLLINVLPEILKLKNNIKLMIVGGGDYLVEAKKLTDKLALKDNVIFTGNIPHEETSQYINASDLFILPTLRQEGLPFVLLEAMACCKPVIASNIGGIPSAINDNENGLLIVPGDSNGLKEKILLLLNNQDLTQKIAESARRTVIEKFSVKKMVEDTQNVIRKQIKKLNPYGIK
jgi:glycosyltransferase involved in cell wall biosynthesis